MLLVVYDDWKPFDISLMLENEWEFINFDVTIVFYMKNYVEIAPGCEFWVIETQNVNLDFQPEQNSSEVPYWYSVFG